MLKRILQLLEASNNDNASSSSVNQCRIYTNKTLKELLQIQDRTLKSLRDNGYLSYSRTNDKYWYTQDDVDNFLKRCRYEAFATPKGAFIKEGGVYD